MALEKRGQVADRNADGVTDTRAAKPREMRQAAEQLAIDFAAAASFVRPEILSM